MPLGKPNRFLDAAKEKRSDEPARAGLSRIDVEGAVVYVDGRATEVEVYGVKLPVSEQGIVRAEGGTFQLVKLDGRDALVPVI